MALWPRRAAALCVMRYGRTVIVRYALQAALCALHSLSETTTHLVSNSGEDRVMRYGQVNLHNAALCVMAESKPRITPPYALWPQSPHNAAGGQTRATWRGGCVVSAVVWRVYATFPLTAQRLFIPV